MVFGSKVFSATYDILKGVNATVWGGLEEAEKVGTIVKTGLSGADTVIGVSHALEDIACNDPVCATLDVVGSLSSSIGVVLGNIPSTKHLTVVTGSVTLACRSVRYYCKNYGTYWGCTVGVAKGVKEVVKVAIKR